MSYTWEKLYTAVRGLATSERSLRERLVCAYNYSLIRLNEDDFPEEMKEGFRQFSADITRFEAEKNEGTVQATVNKIDDSEVLGMIDKILSMYDKISKPKGM